MSITAESRPALAVFAPGTTKYEMLGVSTGATEGDLKVAYRRAALLFHPDRHPEHDRPLAEQVFKDITAAHRTLSNPELRRRYDQALRGGHEYREGASAEGVESLATILGGIQEYECIFSRDQLAALDASVSNVVVEHLIEELGEQVVAVYPLRQAPVNAAYQGTFKTGAVVLTNLRVLMPFTYEWEETSGNVKTTYKGLSVPNVGWPLVTNLQITARRRVSADVLVLIQQEDGSVAFQAGQHNLAELLLIANLWGVPFHVEEQDSRGRELRSALLGPWEVAGWSTVGALAIAAVVGLFTDWGFIDGPMALLSWGNRTGLSQIVVLLTAAHAARRLALWMAAYRPRRLPEMIRDKSASAPVGPGSLVGVG